MIDAFLKWMMSFWIVLFPSTPIAVSTFQPITTPTEIAVVIDDPVLATVPPTATPALTPNPKNNATVKSSSIPVVSNAPNNAGFTKQNVKTDLGIFTVSIVSADIGSTKVIVDTASSSDCFSNCPVLSLSDYVTKNGGYAGVNGSYFCPKDYPSCLGKENTFDLLVMNKDKHYFNSDNNIYSTNPVVGFRNGSVSFVTSGSQWGRDTSLDGVLMNYPLLVYAGNVSFGGDGDPKKGSRGPRSFVANKGNMVYIGVVHSATVVESAQVMKSLGMDNALNLDSGGSTALWYEGYRFGPGRGIPNAIIFKK